MCYEVRLVTECESVWVWAAYKGREYGEVS